jgi:hypothetical protein
MNRVFFEEKKREWRSFGRIFNRQEKQGMAHVQLYAFEEKKEKNRMKKII